MRDFFGSSVSGPFGTTEGQCRVSQIRSLPEVIWIRSEVGSTVSWQAADAALRMVTLMATGCPTGDGFFAASTLVSSEPWPQAVGRAGVAGEVAGAVGFFAGGTLGVAGFEEALPFTAPVEVTRGAGVLPGPAERVVPGVTVERAAVVDAEVVLSPPAATPSFGPSGIARLITNQARSRTTARRASRRTQYTDAGRDPTGRSRGLIRRRVTSQVRVAVDPRRTPPGREVPRGMR